MRVQNFLGDVVRTAAVHLLAGTVSKTLEEAAKEGKKKATDAWKRYQKKTATKTQPVTSTLDAEDALEIPTATASEEMRKLKTGGRKV